VGTLLLLPSQVSQETIASITNTNSPAFFPIIAAFLVILCALILLFKTITLDKRAQDRLEMFPYPRLLLVMSFIFTSYSSLIWFIGMITASILMIPAMAYVLGYRKILIILAVAVFAPIILYILFEKFLLIILPHGIIF
jgi:hypothetical protein